MLHDIYQHLPLFISPIAFEIGPFAIKWYGIMFLIGLLATYGLLRLRVNRGEYITSKSKEISNLLVDYLLVAFFASLVGGRLGYVLFYNALYFFSHPLSIISPLDESGKFVGVYGMSYHGAVLGIVIGSYFFLKHKKINFLAWADFVIPAAAFGYFFGRLGNFLNGELYGRITSLPIGMYFSADPSHLRHPSQLYETILEGILLPIIVWNMRKKVYSSGFLFGVYLVGYGIFRIMVEQFRQPDPQLGLLCNYFTMGQILSLAMILIGLFLLIPKIKK